MRYFASNGERTGYKEYGAFFESRAETAAGLLKAATRALHGKQPRNVYNVRRDGMFTFVDYCSPVYFDWNLNLHY